jgi:hypothetical protein
MSEYDDEEEFSFEDEELDCDCNEDYVCELHSTPTRHDTLFEMAIQTFEIRCINGGPNNIPTFDKMYTLVIKEYLDMIYTDVDVIVKKVNLMNMFRFIMSDRGFNHVMYKSIIQEFNRWIWEARMKYAEDIDIQIIYRDWSKYLLDVRN